MRSKGKDAIRVGGVLKTNAIRSTRRSEPQITPEVLKTFASPVRRRGKRSIGKIVFLGVGLEGGLVEFPEPTFEEIGELTQFGMAVEANFGKSKHIALHLHWRLQTIDQWLRKLFPYVFDYHDRHLPIYANQTYWGLLRRNSSGNLVLFSKEGMCGADLSRAIVKSGNMEKATLYFVTRRAISADVYRNWFTEAAVLPLPANTRNMTNMERYLAGFDSDDYGDLDASSSVDSESEEDLGDSIPSQHGVTEIASVYQRLDSIESRIQTTMAAASSSKTTTDMLNLFSTYRKKRKASIDANELRKIMEGPACGVPSSPVYNPWAED